MFFFSLSLYFSSFIQADWGLTALLYMMGGLEEEPGGYQENRAAKRDTVASGSWFLSHLQIFCGA